jgi:hypothetical protein
MRPRHLKPAPTILLTAVAAAIVLFSIASAASGRPNRPPVLTTHAAGKISLDERKQVTIALQASDPDARDTVHIDALALPPGASLAAHDGNPARAVFRWRPSAAGGFSATFTAQDHGSPRLAVLRTVTFTVRGLPVALGSPGTSWDWAFVSRPVVARATPAAHGRVVADLGTQTPEGTRNLVLVLEQLR